MKDVSVLLDTNVVSYLMKGGSLATAYASQIKGQLPVIAFITVGELYFGAENARWGTRRRAHLEETLRSFVVIPYDHEIARSYGRLSAQRRSIGHQITENDAWIAACALRHGIPLMTHNAKDFSGLSDLEVVTADVDP